MVRQIVTIVALMSCLSMARGQPRFDPPAGAPPPAPGIVDELPDRMHEKALPAPRMAWKRFWLERDNMTTGGKGLRAAFWQELHNVPTLEKYLRDFGKLQRERAMLEQRRREVAQRSDLPSDEALRRFHQILRQEDELTSQAAQLLAELRKERETIAREVRERLEALEQTGDHAKKEWGGRWMVPRWKRFYRGILEKLESEELASSPNEWLGGVFRDFMALDRAAEPTVEGALRQIEKLQREQEELRWHLESIQSQLDDLAELLMAVRHGEGRREQRQAREGIRAPAGAHPPPETAAPPLQGRGERARQR